MQGNGLKALRITVLVGIPKEYPDLGHGFFTRFPTLEVNKSYFCHSLTGLVAFYILPESSITNVYGIRYQQYSIQFGSMPLKLWTSF